MNTRRTAIFFKDTQNKREPAKDWLEKLRDRVGQAAVFVRIARAETGNFGDWKSVGDGVMEMRISVGPGYRLYYAFDGQDVILLLLGGDKSTQSKDIQKAKEFWESHKTRKKRG
jgi:putative addiction module killer protein